MGSVAYQGMEVIDRNETRYTLAAQVGGGSQGEVFRTTGEGAAVKIASSGAERRHETERRIRAVARMPFPDTDCFAMPRYTLKEPQHFNGYTMNFLTGVTPVNVLSDKPNSADLVNWYGATGGL